MLTGSAYRPGRRLTEFGRFFRPETESEEEVESRFWADGVNRSIGREFMGVKASACYKQGEMSCLSCHSMHDSDPNDQLREHMDGNEACLQCHDTFRDRFADHTHHGSDSSGSQCYNCHMPHTNYGLFKATRSHQVTSPWVKSIEHKSRPNACNLCHLDKSLAWTADHLSDWYGQATPELVDDEQTVSAWALWMLRGDAGQRVIAAWHARWSDAGPGPGEEWLAPILISLVDDPYAAVRWVSRASLRSLPGIEELSVEDLANKANRVQFVERARKTWESRASDEHRSRLAEVLGGKDPKRPISDLIEALKERRDNRPIASVE
jgi:predicted CXXCH cytochrome family protein